MPATGLASLTPHQRELLRLYVALGSVKAVAYRLNVASGTVKNTLSVIRHHLDVDSTTQACIILDRAER